MSRNLFGLSWHAHTIALRRARVPAAVISMGFWREIRTTEPGVSVKSRIADGGSKLHWGDVFGGGEIRCEARGHVDNKKTYMAGNRQVGV